MPEENVKNLALTGTTTREEVRKLADSITELPSDWKRNSFNTSVDFSNKLQKVGSSLDQYLDLCRNGDAREEIIASSIDRHVLPLFPAIMKRLAEQARDGSVQEIKVVMELMAKVSTLLAQFQKKNENHLHLHYEKMPEGQLLDEGLYQVKQFLKMQLSLPGGEEKVISMMSDLWKEKFKGKKRIDVYICPVK